MSAGIESVVVAVCTLAVVITRPRGINEGLAALLGGLAVLLLRLVSPGDAVSRELGSWNIFLFFAGMMAIAALADQSGVFDEVARLATRAAGGSVLRLYILVFGLGTLVSVLFANDSAALVLTPIVYVLVVRLSLEPLPFVFAITFIADTASIALPVSNPLNVIVADRFNLALGDYLAHLWLPAILVILINLAAFAILFRRELRGRIRGGEERPRGRRPLSDALILGALAVSYLAASALQLPLGIVSVAGAAALALNLARVGLLDRERLRKEISWPIFAFIAGLLLVVGGLEDAGLTAQLGQHLLDLSTGSNLAAIATSTLGGAVGSNLINNLPMALVMVSTIHALHPAGALRSDLIYGTIVGCDLGPNLTHLGSLSTLIWLLFLRRKGLDVSTWDYFRIGAIVTPLMLAGAIAGLWLVAGR